MNNTALGVDLGARRVGLARSNSARTIATPWRVLERRGDPAADRQALVDAVAESGATTVVVGLPRSLDGRIGPAAAAVQEEVGGLESVLAGRGVTVETVDERFTTVTATDALARSGVRGERRRAVVDAVAAAVLLQAWLDRQSHRTISA